MTDVTTNHAYKIIPKAWNLPEPCPCCGGRTNIFTDWIDGAVAIVECPDCGLNIKRTVPDDNIDAIEQEVEVTGILAVYISLVRVAVGDWNKKV